MKTFQKTLLVTSLMAVTAAASAADPTPPPVVANVALTTNYVWRGVSQSAKQLAMQGGFDYAHASGFYLGTWGSSINFGNDAPNPTDGDGASLELDLYGGYKFKAAGIDWDVGLLAYTYPGSDSSLKYNFTELYVGGTFGPVSVKYFNANDYQGLTEKSGSYLDVAATFDVEGFALGLHYGKSMGDGVNDAFGKEYSDYKLSIGKTFGGYTVSLAYSDTNLTTFTNKLGNAEGQVFLTVSRAL
jgi:uncharacterized protein (TIGR02001 family)